MRVTNRMMINNYQRNLSRNMGKLQQVSNQIASGKEVSKPSQNPFLATRIMDYKTEIAQKEQYQRNIEDMGEFMNVTDSAMGQLNSQMQRLKELAIKAGTGTNSEDERAIIAKEVDGIIKSMVDTLNTSFEDKYIFAGQQTTTKPFELTENPDGTFSVAYAGDSENVKIEISKGVYVDRNITGTEVLGNMNGSTLFDSLIDFSQALKNDDAAKINELVKEIDGHYDNVLQLRGKVGATQSRMELAIEKNKDEVLALTDLLTNTEGVDIAEKYIEFSSLNAGYTASLQISANIIQPTLLDFLR